MNVRPAMIWIAKAAFAGSIALNVGLAWMLLKPPTPKMVAQVAPLGAFRRVASVLPAEDAALLRQAVLKQEPVLREAQRAYQADVARVLEEISKAQFDPAATSAAIDRARQQRQIAADALIDAVLETLPAMTHEGRIALTETTRGRSGAQPSND